MKKYILLTVCVALSLLTIISSCKKNNNDYGANFSTPELTATFGGTTQQYLVPYGMVNYVSNIAMQGYQKNTITNTIELDLNTDSVQSGTYSFSSGSFLQIVNDTTTYSTKTNGKRTQGSATLVVSGNKVTGTFSGSLYDPLGKDSIVVTNGIINGTY